MNNNTLLEVNEQKLYKVYIHTNKNNDKKYVGITCQSLNRRYGNGKGYKECPRFWNAIQKHGWDSIKTEVLFSGLTKEEAEEKEIYLIEKLNTTNDNYGYNIQNGGNTTGTHSPLTRSKIGNAHKGRKKSKDHVEKIRKNGVLHSKRMLGKGNSFYGKSHSIETKNRISKSKKGVSNLKRRIKVVQLDKENKFIKIHDSMRQASDETGTILSGICEACKGNQKTSGGYKWMYLKEYKNMKVTQC